jgi:hypothetical protein
MAAFFLFLLASAVIAGVLFEKRPGAHRELFAAAPIVGSI